MLAGPPLDPDYATAWPAGIGVGRGQRRPATVATVDLTGVGDATAIRDPTLARAAVQQLVWTVTAVAADRGAHPDRGPAARRRRRATLWGRRVAGTADPGRRARHAGPDLARSRRSRATPSPPRSPSSWTARSSRRRSGCGSATPTARSSRTSRCCWTPARRPGARRTVALTLPPGDYTVEAYFGIRAGRQRVKAWTTTTSPCAAARVRAALARSPRRRRGLGGGGRCSAG